MDNELTLFDRIHVIRDVIEKYGEENFYLSFSGGKDSTVLHYLLDEAMPNNKIPRVFINTGIEYIDIVKFVKRLKENDDRIVIYSAGVNIPKMLKKDGYPFKSKAHSHNVAIYQKSGFSKSIKAYTQNRESKFCCPKDLLYQFEEPFHLKFSDLCCKRLKKEPASKWAKEHHKPICLTGMMANEGGARESIHSCVITGKDGKIKKFHPLLKVSVEWEDWYIKERKIELCKLYYQPYNFKRTGCKGCPFALTLQDQLETMERLLPNERKQCEYIWQPVYEEYRRIGYRLKKNEQQRLF